MTENWLKARAAAEFRDLSHLAERSAEVLSDTVAAIAVEVVARLRQGGKLLFCGNGGSAADAQHLAAEYVVRFRRSRVPLRALSLVTDTSVLTAAANDDGFDTVFSRQIEALGDADDVLFLHSTSGESKNLLLAACAAKDRGIMTVALLAKGGGRLRSEVDWSILIPTDDTARAQEMHLAAGHVICDLVEEILYGEAQ